jgi:HK97 gp10 family phage protein
MAYRSIYYTVDFDGLYKAIGQLEAFKNRKVNDIKGAVKDGGDAIQRLAKQNAPVDTGVLRASIYNKHEGLEAFIGTNKDYGLYQEYGTGIYAVAGNGRKTPWRYYYRGNKGPHGWRTTRGNKPQPWLVPAFNEGIPVYLKEIREALGRW